MPHNETTIHLKKDPIFSHNCLTSRNINQIQIYFTGMFLALALQIIIMSPEQKAMLGIPSRMFGLREMALAKG